ncbi:MAG: GntR family transcriptional regulator [Sphaerochaetaceae bacterium]|nr:GntR family transcriptional regulator [Sphaerochaetaceae bacterium]
MDQINVSLPLSQQLANSIRKGIISGELKNGEKISVNIISQMFGVSGTPVKEAFKILQSEGLVVAKPRSGTIISDFATSSIRNLVYIRSALEGVAVNFATRGATDEEFLELEHLLDGADDAIRGGTNLARLISINTDFHRKIRELARNQYLYSLIEQFVAIDLSVREHALGELELKIKGAEEHRLILRLMKERKADEAESAMISHIRKTVQTVVERT